MPEFIMDRDGVVNGMTFDDLSDIFQGYIECMLFTETSFIPMVSWSDAESQEAIGQGTSDGTIPNDAGWGDISPDAAQEAQLDVMNFKSQSSHLLSMAYARGYDRKQAGRDFWFTRNHHGCGFWDRKELERDNLGDMLTEIAQTFGEVNVSFDPDEGSPTGYGHVNFY